MFLKNIRNLLEPQMAKDNVTEDQCSIYAKGKEYLIVKKNIHDLKLMYKNAV